MGLGRGTAETAIPINSPRVTGSVGVGWEFARGEIPGVLSPSPVCEL